MLNLDIYPSHSDAPGDKVLGREVVHISNTLLGTRIYWFDDKATERLVWAGDLPESIIERQERGEGGCSGRYREDTHPGAWRDRVCQRPHAHEGDHGPKRTCGKDYDQATNRGWRTRVCQKPEGHEPPCGP